MGLDFDEPAKRERDKRLRRKLLATLHLNRFSPLGGLTARTLVDLAQGAMPPGQKIEDDRHALALLRDLENKGLIEQKPLPRRRGQEPGVDYLFVKITAKGSSLWLETSPPDPDIDDDRVVEGE